MKKLIALVAVLGVSAWSIQAYATPLGTGKYDTVIISTTLTVPASSIDTSKITGVFSTARIPSLDTSKITTGVFNSSFIPATLDTSKITTGAFAAARIGSGSIDTTKLLNSGISGTGTLLCYTADGKIGKVTAAIDTGKTGTCAAF